MSATSLTAAQQAFRTELRAWLAAHPPGPEPTEAEEQFAWRRALQRRLFDAGFAGIAWPTEHGGRGLTVVEQSIVDEELARLSLFRPFDFVGLQLAGPSIIHHGNADQQRRWLEPILRAEAFWCQGFSEPEAGSDLASLRTYAERSDGAWRVHGQKIWTSTAHKADWCLLLARTDRLSRRSDGLTFFVMDMREPGIDVRRLRQATGDDDFNELFLDGVRIPDTHVIGEIGRGWEVAMGTLGRERASITFGYSLQLQRTLADLIAVCRERGLDRDADVRARLAQFYVDSQILRRSGLRGLALQAAQAPVVKEGSLSKLHWARVSQALAAFAVEVLGEPAVIADAPWSQAFVKTRGDSIKAGTSEIQANILAERVLGLPRARR